MQMQAMIELTDDYRDTQLTVTQNGQLILATHKLTYFLSFDRFSLFLLAEIQWPCCSAPHIVRRAFSVA
jgi:hypothetical protein